MRNNTGARSTRPLVQMLRAISGRGLLLATPYTKNKIAISSSRAGSRHAPKASHSGADWLYLSMEC